MTKDQAMAVVRSLLERIDGQHHAFAGLVSPTDREAIGALLELATGGGVIEGSSTEPAAAPAPAKGVRLNADGLREPGEPGGALLCLDFGTAKSKAFASHSDALLPLPVGDLDHDLDGSLFAVASSVWIDESGLVFVGSEAIRRGELKAADGRRQRLDSLKQLVSQASSLELLTHNTLSEAENPTGRGITPDDVITLYLGYLTDLATTALEKEGQSRYVMRRFSLPCWSPTHRQWSAPYLASLIGRAQLVADTFHGRWQDGISVDEMLAVVAAARRHDEAALRWVASDESRAEHHMPRWGGVLEPLAAGSASVWRSVGRELVFVVDIGAGTTDFAVFLVVQGQPQAPGHRAIPVAPIADAVRFAGDFVDDILLNQLLHRGHIDPTTTLGAQARASVRLSGLRRIKERLFFEGAIEVPLTHDIVVAIGKDELLRSTSIRDFETQLHTRIRRFLESIDRTFAPLFASVTLVLTGGSRDLPMIASLAGQQWSIHDAPVRFKLAPRIPREFEKYGTSFAREYPQLAVAIGGASASVLDERDAIETWAGGEAEPGPLTRFQTKGI